MLRPASPPSGCCDRQTRGAPLREACLETADTEPVCLQQLRRLVRKHAVRASAVGHDFTVARQLLQTLLELLHRYGPRIRDMALAVLERRANIQQGDAAARDQTLEL